MFFYDNNSLDLEAMGTSADAAIVSIGAVAFDPSQSSELWFKFRCNISLKSAVAYGGKIDPDTIIWWMSQSKEAQEAWLERDSGTSITTALDAFSSFLETATNCGEAKIWGNGSDFDNVILASAYKRADRTPPWNFRNNRCFRTLKADNSHIPYEKPIKAHDALEDALAQAKHIVKIWDSRKGPEQDTQDNLGVSF